MSGSVFRATSFAIVAIAAAALGATLHVKADLSASTAASILCVAAGLVTMGTTAALLVGRKKLELLRVQLEESRVELQNFTDSVPQLLWRARPDGVIDFFNRRYDDLTGKSRWDAVSTQNWRECFHPDDRPLFLEKFQSAVAKETDLRMNFRLRHADGHYRWMSLSGRCVRSSTTSGTLTRWYGGTSDVHEEYLAHQQISELNETLEHRVEERTAELLRTQERYAGLFAVSNMTYAEMDFSGTFSMLDDIRNRGVVDLRAYMAAHPAEFAHCLSLIRTVRVNDALARLMGYDDVADLVANPPAQNADDGPEVLLRQLEMHWEDVDHIEGRSTLVGKQGISIPIYYTVTRLPGGIHLSSHLDLTEQERIEELRQAAQKELARANRAATMGAFSASIAHELNQPVASMVMDAQTGLRWLRKMEPDVGAAERILERLSRSAQRVASIIQRTRENIVAGRRAVESVDMYRLAVETGELLAREMRRADVHLDIRCDEAVPAVRGYRVDLQQVLVNLMGNAVEALCEMPGRRNIIVAIVHVREGVAVSVIDTGPGIPPENISKLFQPFFTTKAAGIGMGLQICKSAIESMGGELTVINRPEGGAEFSFLLPLPTNEDEGADARDESRPQTFV